MKKILTVAMLVLLATTLIVSCADPKAKAINITYDLNGGTLAEGVTNPTTATAGEKVTPTGPTRDTSTQDVSNYSIDDYLYCDTASGVTTTYTFKGWKVEGADDSTASETYTAGTEDVKLVAVWDTTSTATSYTGIKLKNTVSTGTTVTLGSYNNSQLTWKVLSVDTANKKALLFAANVVSTSMKNHTSSNLGYNYSWGNTSPIYNWFNNTTNTGFLKQCKLDNVSMVDNGNVGKVFLLSDDDVTTYLPNDSDRTCDYSWWLRTGGSAQGTCKYVIADGGTVYDKQANTECAVRPAFWISL